METREEDVPEMNGHLRLTHEQRALATKMPGCAAWVWFELLAWHGKPVSRGRLLDASGADSLRTVERALAYLLSIGLAVSFGDTWASGNGQNCDTKKKVLATPTRQQLATDGDKSDDTMVTKLSLENQNEAVINEVVESPKETNDIKETKETNISSKELIKTPSDLFEIPSSLESLTGFKEVWLEYLEHRRQKRSKLTSVAAKNCLAMLERETDPIAKIRESLEKGWTGIFPTKPKNQTKPTPRASINDEAYWEAETARQNAEIEALLAATEDENEM
jgi:hypothetical protein